MNAARSLRTIVRQTRIETVSLETIAEYMYRAIGTSRSTTSSTGSTSSKEALGCSDEEAEHLVLNRRVSTARSPACLGCQDQSPAPTNQRK